MSHKVAVDTLPEYEGLVLSSSSLMLQAKGHRARGETFESAVAWIKAADFLADLGARRLSAGYIKEAAEDLLNAAHCYLEAGDPRPANRVLEQFDKAGDLGDSLRRFRHLRSEHDSVCRRYGIQNQRLARARADLQRQMGHFDAAHKLKVRWLDQTIAAMPGVPDFHWFAAMRYASGERYDRAVEHLYWCVQLAPTDFSFWLFRIQYLSLSNRHEEAVAFSDEAVRQHPDNARVRWFAGWARILYVLDGRGSKLLLDRAMEHLERAVSLGQLTPRETVAARCSTFLCLQEKGQKRQAKKLLEDTVRDFPAPACELAWRMSQAKSARDRNAIMRNVPELMIPSAA